MTEPKEPFLSHLRQRDREWLEMLSYIDGIPMAAVVRNAIAHYGIARGLGKGMDADGYMKKNNTVQP